jgi:hypothetical protein
MPGDLGGHGVLNNAANGIVNITRIKGSNYGPATVGITYGSGAANNNQAAIIRFQELEYGPLGAAPHGIVGTYQMINISSNKAIFYTSTGGVETLADAAASADFPPVSSVRLGTKFNNNNLTGTLAVPPASAVSQGIAVDNTAGTAALTPDSVWSYALSAATTLNTTGNRLAKTVTKSDSIALY